MIAGAGTFLGKYKLVSIETPGAVEICFAMILESNAFADAKFENAKLKVKRASKNTERLGRTRLRLFMVVKQYLIFGKVKN
jgi:hypothetical protein